MARAFPLASSTAEAETPSRDWQALRGELVALLDQMEGHYDRDESSGSGLAQRVRDLRSQVVESDPDNRRREALRSVKRQLDRFSDRSEHDPADGENALQSAIAQIRARPPVAVDTPAPALRIPAVPPRYDDMARTMSGLSNRLGEFESELGTQRSNRAQVREIAEQVGQLSRVVELLAGAVGETGQVKRLENQIADLADLIGKGQQVDLSQLTERLDQVAATVDRLADLQVQQIQHVVREAESVPQKDAETVRGIQAIEASIRSLYDRIDSLESGMGAPSGELERISDMLGQIASRLSIEGNRPDRLLSLVDALNGRIREIEDTGYNLGSLRGDLTALRDAVIGAVEPRFSAIEQQLGDLGERLDGRAGDGSGIAQVEAQIRQLVARMDQTGEQLSLLARQTAIAAPDFETLATLTAKHTAEALNEDRKAPDFDELADRVAARTQKAMAAPQRLPAAELEAMADMIAGRTRAVLADRGAQTAAASDLSEASLVEIEDRVSRLVDGFLRAQASDASDGVSEGMQRVEERLAQLETALSHRADEHSGRAPAPLQEAPRPLASKSVQIQLPVEDQPAPREPRPVNDMMPRDPAVEAPLKEFGFPDLGPVRAALEARNGPRLRPLEPKAKEASSAIAPEPAPAYAAAPAEPAEAALPPRPQSIFEREVNSAFEAPVPPTAAPGEPVPPSSRNTFIEAARRSAQRQNAMKTSASPDSPIGRALSRLQTAKPEKPASIVEAAAGDAAADVPPQKTKARKRGLLGRAAKPGKIEPMVAAPTPAPKSTEPPPVKAGSTPNHIADARKARHESFLNRHRRAILLGASVIAIAFMTLNLVEQRLAPTDDQSTALPAIAMAKPAANPVTPVSAPKATVAASAATPPPAAPRVTAGLSAKPASLAFPLPLSAPEPANPGAGPRIAPATDPTTTASIAADEPGRLDKATLASPMPPSLAAPAPTPTTTDAAAAGAPGAAAVADQGTPPILQSPVKVDLPPSTVGPLALRQAAANGDARSQFEVGAIYSEGRIVPQDFKQASVWYERGAEQGFVPAEYRLGNLYETGKGVAKDYEQAHLWYQRAAEAGNRMAMHNLAALYAGGQFGKQDFASAASWFEQAANQGIRDSQFNLGMLYARGLGVPQSLPTSYKWFALAALSGDTGAAKARDDIARSLDAAQLKEAKVDVAAFKPAAVNLAANFAPIGTWDKSFNPGPTIAAKDVVLKVQQALAQLGYDVGAPDGQAGPRTAQAIKSFEQGTGMTQVGAINPRLLAVLGSQPV